MLLSDAINDFLNYARHEQGYAVSSCKQRQSWLRHLHQWLVDNGYPTPTTDDLNTIVLRRFQYSLSGRKLRPRTIQNCFYPVKSLCIFLIKNNVLTANPCDDLTLPKKDAAVRLDVSEEEIVALLEATRRQRNPRRVALCHAVFSVLVNAGLRRQELLGLRVGDIDLKQRSILVRCGKGSKSRKVYV